MNIRKLALVALLASAAVAPAQAGHFIFQYQADPGFSDPAGPEVATLYLTTSDSLNGVGGYDILSATGAIDGAAVLGLVPNPNQPNEFADGVYRFDNVLLSPDLTLSMFGLVVTTASMEINFGYDSQDFGAVYPYYAISADGSTHISPRTGQTVPNTFLSVGTASLTAAAVPEPAAWAMMVAGFGLAGAAMRRRHATVAFA